MTKPKPGARRGRPFVGDASRRDRTVAVRVTPEELALITAAAERASLDTATWARHAVLAAAAVDLGEPLPTRGPLAPGECPVCGRAEGHHPSCPGPGYAPDD